MPKMPIDEIITELRKSPPLAYATREQKGEIIAQAITILERVKEIGNQNRFKNHEITHYLETGEWEWGD
jgi:hypothetical protein